MDTGKQRIEIIQTYRAVFSIAPLTNQILVQNWKNPYSLYKYFGLFTLLVFQNVCICNVLDGLSSESKRNQSQATSVNFLQLGNSKPTLKIRAEPCLH